MSGTLVTTFGTSGTVVAKFSQSNTSRAVSVAVDQGNKIIVAGNNIISNINYYCLAKYLPSGILDTSFGTNGTVIQTNYANTTANSVALDQNNNIIIAGNATSGNYFLAKYSSLGILDTTFGTNGIVFTTYAGLGSNLKTITTDQNNNIFTGGSANLDAGLFAVSKLLSNGSLDSTFGTGGSVVFNTGLDNGPTINSIKINQNNNIICVGTTFYYVGEPSNYYALNILSPNGTVTTAIANQYSGTSNNSEGNSVAIDQNNNIIIAGHIQYNPPTSVGYYALAKYSSSGVLDTTFGTNGSVIASPSTGSYNPSAVSVAIDQINKIIVYINFNGYYALAKYSSSGVLDTSFGSNGSAVASFSDVYSSIATSMAIDPIDNKIVVAGYIPDNGYYGLAKYFNYNYPCFKEGSKILTNKGYIPIQDLRKGDLVKTVKHNYKPIEMIGKREIYHPALKERIKDQLYQCSNDAYPEIFETLVITGCHSILVENSITVVDAEQIEKVKEVNGGIYLTDDKLRLPACIDERTSIYPVPGTYMIYHLALENDDYFMNYGIYANGLLVETCSKRYLYEVSGMTLLKE